MAGRARRWWAVATAAAAVALAGLVVFFIAVGVDQADKWSSTLGIFVAVAGLAVSAYGAVTARRRSEPAAISDVDVERPLRLPGVLPVVWNVPAHSAAFTGRTDLLAALRQRLDASGPLVIQAMHGLGGVGKTTLVIEYAHRFDR